MAEEFYIFRRSGRDNLYVQFRNLRTGKLGAARSSGKTSEAAAIRWAKGQLKAIVEAEAGRPTSSWTVGAWAKPFFGDKCLYLSRKKIEGETFSTHYCTWNTKYIEKYILPDDMASIALCDLRRSDVLAWRKRMVDSYGSTRTIQRVLQVFKIILNEAVYQEIIEYSPASKVSMPVCAKHERTAISLEALGKLLKPDLYAEPRHWMGTIMAAFTGMRASEIRALEWTALDFDRRLILVTQAFKDQTSRLGPPKNGKARVAPMSEGLAKLLLEWKPRCESDKWVFGFSENRPLGYKEWNYAVKKAAKAAGCEGATLHYLRHTLNTYLRGAGVDDVKLQASFGWSGPGIQGNYSHAEHYDYKDQSAAIDRIIKIGGNDGKEDQGNSERL